MASVYDRTDIYDLFDSPKKDAQTLSHWQTVFDGRPIRSALDVSIGTGSLTLPLGQLGVSLYGSDLSGSMLARCRKKADERGIAILPKAMQREYMLRIFSEMDNGGDSK